MTLAAIKAVNQVVTQDYAIYEGDACELVRGLPDDSVHFGLHSPPFEGLYKFSNDERDLSNSEGEAFWEHYAFLIGELARATMPGRIHAVHVMQLPMSKLRHGAIGIRDFRGEVVRAFAGSEAEDLDRAIRRLKARRFRLEATGDVAGFSRLDDIIARLAEELSTATDGQWIFHSETCIWKDPVVAQQRTKSLRLLHKQLVKDSAMSGQGLADFILAFRKPGDNPEPVKGALSRWIGEGPGPDRSKWTSADDARNWYSIEVWQRYASPVWSDIRQTDTLQFRAARDEKDEQHISPLQLDVIGRCIDLWSNPGDIVLTPFMGIGSEVWGAVMAGRRGVGFELKPSYYAQAAINVADAVAKRGAASIFGEAAA